MAVEKVIVYRSQFEKNQDEMWMKFLDMNPWIVQGFVYLCIAAVVGIVLYTGYCIVVDRIRWRGRR